MKKFLAVLLAALLTVGMSVSAFGAAPPEKVEIIPLAHGYATVTTTVERPAIVFLAVSPRKKASKIYKAYNSDNRLLWSYTLNGEFTYTTTSATATGASDSYSISNSDWHKDYSSTDYSGDTVYGDATFSSTLYGESCSLSITCGPGGTIS